MADMTEEIHVSQSLIRGTPTTEIWIRVEVIRNSIVMLTVDRVCVRKIPQVEVSQKISLIAARESLLIQPASVELYNRM